MPKNKIKTIDREIQAKINALRSGKAKNPEKTIKELHLLFKESKKKHEAHQTINLGKAILEQLNWWGISYKLHHEALQKLASDIIQTFHAMNPPAIKQKPAIKPRIERRRAA